MRRFFTQQALAENTQISLCEQSYHHWVRVLRAKVGEKAVLFNGAGGEYIAEIISISKKTAQVALLSFSPINRENAFKTTLAIVLSKGDRMDYALQKSTELGVHDIQLLTSQHCEVKLTGERLQKKLKNWQGVITAACEQCGLNLVPQLHAPMPISHFISTTNHACKVVLAPTAAGKANMPFQQGIPQEICLLIGAEGGLTDDEIAQAQQHGFVAWCLGERILRTETAPVAALASIAQLHTVHLENRVLE